jgi:hypothetical protein
MRPEHYSREIAQRCQALIRHLHPIVQRGLPDDGMFGGPLETTFLLAMATPMIVLPIERIHVAEYNSSQVGDDRGIDPALAKKMSAVLDGKCRFSDAPFGTVGKWSYVTSYTPIFNLADGCPDDLLTALGTQESAARANDAQAGEILHVVRNALAHGGVAYLDKNGRSTEREAAMLAFISTERDKQKRVTGLNVLRIGQTDFHSFLMAWTDWLIH